jgi:hypothetical protein
MGIRVSWRSKEIEWLEEVGVDIGCRPKTYNKTGLFDVAGKCSVLGQETVS